MKTEFEVGLIILAPSRFGVSLRQATPDFVARRPSPFGHIVLILSAVFCHHQIYFLPADSIWLIPSY